MTTAPRAATPQRLMQWQDLLEELDTTAGVALDPAKFDAADLRDLIVEHGLCRAELELRRTHKRPDLAAFVQSGIENGQRAESDSAEATSSITLSFFARQALIHQTFAAQCMVTIGKMTDELGLLRDLVSRLPERFRLRAKELDDNDDTGDPALITGQADGWRGAAQALENELLVIASKVSAEAKHKGPST